MRNSFRYGGFCISFNFCSYTYIIRDLSIKWLRVTKLVSSKSHQYYRIWVDGISMLEHSFTDATLPFWNIFLYLWTPNWQEVPDTVPPEYNKTCNYRNTDYHEQIYKWVAGRGCLQFTPAFLYVNGTNNLNLNSACFYGEFYAPCLELVSISTRLLYRQV